MWFGVIRVIHLQLQQQKPALHSVSRTNISVKFLMSVPAQSEAPLNELQ